MVVRTRAFYNEDLQARACVTMGADEPNLNGRQVSPDDQRLAPRTGLRSRTRDRIGTGSWPISLHARNPRKHVQRQIVDHASIRWIRYCRGNQRALSLSA